MTTWRTPGQMVVCVDPWEWFTPDPRRLPGLHERDVLTIRNVWLVSDAEISPVLLRFFELADFISWYPAQRFRPIAKPSIEGIRALLNPSPKITKERA